MIALPEGIKIPECYKYLFIALIFFFASISAKYSADGWEANIQQYCQGDSTCFYFNTTKMHSDRLASLFFLTVSFSFGVLFYFAHQK